MFELLVDFNDIRNGVVAGLVDDASGRLQPGDAVRLHDDGEHECVGTVQRVDGGLIYAKMDWSTWRSASERVDLVYSWYVLGGGLVGASAPAPQMGWAHRVENHHDFLAANENVAGPVVVGD